MKKQKHLISIEADGFLIERTSRHLIARITGHEEKGFITLAQESQPFAGDWNFRVNFLTLQIYNALEELGMDLEDRHFWLHKTYFLLRDQKNENSLHFRPLFRSFRP